MKLKRLISSLLLALYLMATGGPACVSLSCECVVMGTHTCCLHCQHDDNTSSAQEVLKAPCCGNHHSTEIELYTSVTSDNNERFIRCAVTDLPPALVAEVPNADDVLLCCEKIVERRVVFVEQEHVRCAGLRAPPVLA